MAVHIRRRHKGLDNPFELPSNQRSGVTRFGTPDGGTYPWSNAHHKISGYHHEGLAEDFNLPKGALSPREKDPRNSLIEEIDEAIKITNTTARSTNQPLPPDLTPTLINSILFRNFNPNILLHLAEINKNKNVGFRGNICSNCFTGWIEPLYNNEGEMKSLIYTKSLHHVCESEKLVEAEKVQDARIKKTELENQLATLLLSLTYICATLQNKKPYLVTRELIYPPSHSINYPRNQSIDDVRDNYDQKPYLRCWVEGEQVNCNNIDIALPTVDDKHWASRAITECVKSGESTFELKFNEINDFLKAANGTLGVLTTSKRSFFMHISFRAK